MATRCWSGTRCSAPPACPQACARSSRPPCAKPWATRKCSGACARSAATSSRATRAMRRNSCASSSNCGLAWCANMASSSAEASAPGGWDTHVHVFDAAVPARSGHYVPATHSLAQVAAIGAPHSRPRDWQALAELARAGAWIKLSGWYRLGAHPPYDELAPLLMRVGELFGERMVWGSDWPHTSLPDAPPYASLLQPVRAAFG